MNPGPPDLDIPFVGIPADPLKKGLIPYLDYPPLPPNCWNKVALQRLRTLMDTYPCDWFQVDNMYIDHFTRIIRGELCKIDVDIRAEEVLFELQMMQRGRGPTRFLKQS